MNDTPDTPTGNRLAKVIARAGLASRRDAETMIAEGRVSVNGKTVDSPALNVGPRDKVAVDGKPLPEAEAARLWLYHKPAGLVTTEKDEKDRETVFDALRDRLGRVLSVGRLDLTSEGLLLLTNDGELKRKLELPDTGWLRRYRVRVNGKPGEAALQKLRDGIEIDGETFQGMQVTFDRQQGANAWLTIGLREGKNREIRRAAEAVGLYVNRLIRVSYGPFQLGNLGVDEVEEIKPRVLRDQLSTIFDGDFAEAKREDPVPARAPRAAGDRLVDKGRGKPQGRPGAKPRDDRGPRDEAPRGKGPRPDRGDRPRTAKPPVTRNDETRADRPARGPGGKPGFAKGPARRDGKPGSERRDAPPARDGKPFGKREDSRGDRKAGPGGTERKTKSERKAEMRADTSVSLRKGGQRGRGIAKGKKPAGGKPYVKPKGPRG
ncbi:pseudouridine synthase [Jannaschia sp. M317]|uniref:pseudouridine synthase n=1 Tax=Jannaschia sp. M317 TaxID=2867011 RepID=UPI0021A8239B|nr:pseudouridine synthase [Jannaschia sp. M317]UWQ17996.1 pseudouridine synthase [Jannaschia sp. M317]